MGKIYFDITDLLHIARANDTVSGVPRFVTQIIAHSIDRRGTDCVRLIAYHPKLKRLLSYDGRHLPKPFRYDPIQLRDQFSLRRAAWAPAEVELYVESKYGKRQIAYQCTRLLLKNFYTRGREFRKRGIKIGPPGRPVKGRNPEALLEPGDVVFVGGATWGISQLYAELARLQQRRGVRLYQYVHDMIPLVTPEHVSASFAKQYEKWLTMVAKQSDCILTNSVASLNDLEGWLLRNGMRVKTRVLQLAHQFADTPPNFQQARHGVRSHVLGATRLPYVLCVGTLESRKNIWALANVWLQIHAKLGTATPRLIFAGKHGHFKDDFDDFIKGTGSLYGYIRIIERPSDADLAYLYRNCLFSIYPSYKEGWGLPIGESLWFGRPVICSNVSSMPEVGGDLADYFDPMSPQSIEHAALKLITDTEYRERRATQIASARLRSWSDVADDLWRALSESED